MSSPYEVPESPELILDTENKSIKECVGNIIQYLVTYGYISKLELANMFLTSQ